jgi:hypothetical protein
MDSKPQQSADMLCVRMRSSNFIQLRYALRLQVSHDPGVSLAAVEEHVAAVLGLDQDGVALTHINEVDDEIE